jgi:hypothetical protein
MNPHDHPLFKQYPLTRQARLSTGEAPVPYHIYSGYGALVGGTADLAAVRQLLQGEQVTPVQTAGGQALMGVWLCDFTDASLGSHTELQFSVFVSRESHGPVDAVPDHPLSLLVAMLARPEIQMMCHGLWNNTPGVVAYNRELLGLNARRSESVVARDAQALTFQVQDGESGAPVCAGRLSKPRQASPRANLAMLAQMGLGRMQRVAQQPWVSMQVVNPISPALPRNAVAHAFTHNDANVLRYFDPRADSLAIGNAIYQRLQFTPQFVQHMDGFKFVYLSPEELA